MAGARPTRNHHEEAGPEVDRTDHPTRQPSTRHRDDDGKTVLPRPGTPGDPHPSITSRITARALTQARATLTTADHQILRARGDHKWRLTMRIDSARAMLRAAEIRITA